MKTQWTKPGMGATLTDLLTQAHAALPHLCDAGHLGDDRRTNLSITETGTWEPYDIERIRNCEIAR